MKPFKILKTEKLLDEPFAKVQKEVVELPNGDVINWYVNREAGDSVRILPILKTGEVLMERCYRHGTQSESFEFPAGMVDPGEAPQQAMEREMLEEVGYRAEKIIYLGGTYYDANRSNAKTHYFLGLGCEKVQEPEQEPCEQIEPFMLENIDAVYDVLVDKPVTKGDWTLWGMLHNHLKRGTIEL